MYAPAIHSRYNPQEEAERYADSLHINENIEYFILIEPGEGYLVPALRKRHPGAKIVTLHAVSTWPPFPDTYGPVWSPGGAMGIQQFLEQEIPDVEAERIKVVEWRPARSAYGKAYLLLMAETAAFVKRIDANARTTRLFGRRWFRNFFKNLSLLESILVYRQAGCPVLVTGAGPSLEDDLDLIKELGERLFIIAASSSVPALLAAGIRPDLLVATDGGGWALLHLWESLRAGPPHEKPFGIAASLCAALPSQCAGLPLLPIIDDGSLWQKCILDKLECPRLSAPQRGTVTAAALDLAFMLKQGDVYVSGIDLGNRDIRTHARPYAFDRLMSEDALRLRPFYSQSFERARALADGGSHRIYASWFSRQRWPGRIIPLAGGGFFGRETSAAVQEALRGETATARPEALIVAPPGAALRERAVQVLLDALEARENGPVIRRELEALLLNGPEQGDDPASLCSLVKELGRASHE